MNFWMVFALIWVFGVGMVVGILVAGICDRQVESINDDDTQHYCGDCGYAMQLVRPGKWQCNNGACPSNDIQGYPI